MKTFIRNSLLTGALSSCCFAAMGGATCLMTQQAFANTSLTDDNADAVKKRIAELGAVAKATLEDGKVVEISVTEASRITDEDLELFAKQSGLRKLQILNCRTLNNDSVKKITGLKNLKSLALTNTSIEDAAVEEIVNAFPNLTELDLSSNANMSSGVMKPISKLVGLQQLLLLQTRLNEISTRRLTRLPELRVIDLRGNMEAGDMTMEVLGQLPKLKALKHRSTAVTDNGMELLSKTETLENLLIQDFAITGVSGQHLAKISKLSQLEIFRCQGFGDEGVLALKGLGLQRLTLRDLPIVGDAAMEVFQDLPKLKRLYIHEISSVTDAGLKNLEKASSVELLDIWSVPMTDATVDVIAKLPNLKELSIRSTGITDASIEKILKMENLQSLVLKDNPSVSAASLKKLSAKKWSKLDLGQAK